MPVFIKQKYLINLIEPVLLSKNKQSKTTHNILLAITLFTEFPSPQNSLLEISMLKTKPTQKIFHVNFFTF